MGTGWHPYSSLSRGSVSLSELLLPILLLLPQIRVFFNLCLVEAVDDGVLALLDVYALDLQQR